MPIVASLARATLLEAVRNRLLWLAVVVVVIAFGLAQFLNQVAITESREIQTALLAAPLRFAAVFIVAVFVITSMVRELSDKVTELLLSLPAPRSAYFFGKFAGYAMLASILALLSALPLPALDGMTQTNWLLGSGPGLSTLGPVVGQTAIYLVLICSAAIFDLYRRNF